MWLLHKLEGWEMAKLGDVVTTVSQRDVVAKLGMWLLSYKG